MYKVEYLSTSLNDWITRSWHKNREYAEVNYEVLLHDGGKCRIIYEGRILVQN